MLRTKQKWIVICLLTALLLSGCSPIVSQFPQTTDIYTTFYPLYALTQQIAEGVEGVEVHCLVQPQDDCIRTYSLSDWDLYLLGYSADAVIAAGNGLEGFQEKLEEIGETLLPVAEVFSGIEMHDFPSGKMDEDSHFSGANPHVYMSLNCINDILDNIAGAMSILDSENAAQYEANKLAAQTKFDKLKQKIDNQTEVCTDVNAAVMHEALFYSAMECGLNISSVFARESGEMLYGSSLDECLASCEENDVELILLEKQAPKALVDILTESGYIVVQLDVLSTLQKDDGSEEYAETIMNNAQSIFDACVVLAS